MLAVISLLIVAVLSLLTTRIATVALTATGMHREAARFQARSALTGVGYTTSEAEQVTSHPVRRRIVLWLMLAGNVGLVTTAAALIGSFANTGGPGRALARGLVLLGGLTTLYVASRNRHVDAWLSRVIGRLLQRHTGIDVHDRGSLLHLSGDYTIAELQARPGDWLVGRSLAEADLTHEGVLVLGIVRDDGTYLGTPTGSDVIHAYDLLLVYGRGSVLADLDERHAGASGDAAHLRAVAEHRQIEAAEHSVDRAMAPHRSS